MEIARYFKGQMVKPTQVYWFENSCFNFIKPFIADLTLTNITKFKPCKNRWNMPESNLENYSWMLCIS